MPVLAILVERKNMKRYTEEEVRRWAKGGTHEHFDCSIEPEFILAQGARLNTGIPDEFVAQWLAAGNDPIAQARVAAAFQNHVAAYAQASLTNYLNAIGQWILPVLQTPDALYDRAMSRFRRAEEDGLIWLKLRFAPQLHRQQGMRLPQVMEAMVAAVNDSPIPAKLVVCALLHENGRLAQHLADMCIRYRQHVSNFDLAGGEGANPGLLPWFGKQALRVRQTTRGRVKGSAHMWEECEPTPEDVRNLRKYRIDELAHGFRGGLQGNRVCAMCVTSNIVTAQVSGASEHTINALYEAGKRVCVDTDGTLFTKTDYTREYMLMIDTFGWTPQHFLTANLNALSVSGLDWRLQRQLEDKLRACYR
jgi:adenosine deaminase